MDYTARTWKLHCFLQVIILNFLVLDLCQGSVLPRPNLSQRSTTQIANLDKNYTGEGTIVIVTSSELPKQIPPPPTPTKPQRPTPKYDVTTSLKELFFNKNEINNKDLVGQFRLVP